MTNTRIDLTVNGREVSAEVEPRLHLADFVREDLLLTATHLGCEQGVCGACTVMKDGRPVRGCLTLAVSCQGADINTLEGFEDDALMNTVRAAFKQHHGLQCGFCTPGMLTTAYDLVRRLPDADEARIRKEISGNLCRCTGYQGAVNAIKHVLANRPPAADLVALERSTPRATGLMPTGTVDAAPPPTSSSPEEQPALNVPESIENGVNLTRTLRLAAPAERLKRLFRDIPTVASCIPGAELTGPAEGDPIRGFIAVTIGPMASRFAGVARVRYREGDSGGSIMGRGQDKLTRSQLDGALDYTLRPINDDETELHLEIIYRLSGFLAQVGRPAIVEQIADRLLEETAARLTAKATGAETQDAPQKPLNAFALILASLRNLFSGVFGKRS